uniref:Rrnad1_1 protein n=1 Tax=Fopius arisanus TaxID=64838 RepID=A0A0C9RSV0_9HYME
MSEFGEVLELLLAHRWLFQSPVTKILVDQVLDKFPEGWADALESLTIEELNAMVIGGLVREDWPSSLVQFVRKCEEIRKELSKDSFALDAGVDRMEKIPKELIRGLSEKKQHEALLLGQLTHEISEEEGLELIVDLGAGLGYVCQLLHHLFNYKVLGLESNPRIVATANNRRNTLYPLSRSSVNYSCLRVSEDSSGEIEKLVEDFTGDENTNFCLIGLHSCGDLSNNALRLFKEMNRARVLVMMSCCYHKIEWLEDETRFKNFPMSRGLQQELERLENFQGVREVLGRPFMRLACQEPSEKWQDMTPEDHGVHSICVIARGVLELFCHRSKNFSHCKMQMDFKFYLEK